MWPFLACRLSGADGRALNGDGGNRCDALIFVIQLAGEKWDLASGAASRAQAPMGALLKAALVDYRLLL